MAIPTQTRAVDPFSSYDSDNVNRLTTMVTNGSDKLLADEYLLPSITATTNLVDITGGIAIKDDVLIQIPSDFQLDASDPFNYTGQALIDYPTVEETYIVLQYQYLKTPQVPEAQILFLTDISDYDTDLHIFLGKAHFASATTIDNIALNDGSVVRPVANLCDPYTDQDARDAQNISNNNVSLAWTGTAINHYHGLGLYPIIQIMDNDGGGDQGQLVQADITHVDTNQFTIDFDANNTSSPFNFILIY
jgi:hypothetical protein